jgi:hypothetical protein
MEYYSSFYWINTSLKLNAILVIRQVGIKNYLMILRIKF